MSYGNFTALLEDPRANDAPPPCPVEQQALRADEMRAAMLVGPDEPLAHAVNVSEALSLCCQDWDTPVRLIARLARNGDVEALGWIEECSQSYAETFGGEG